MIAASLACADIVHIRRLLMDIGHPQEGPTLLLEDNKSVIDAARNLNVSTRLKHVEIAEFWCRELDAKGIIMFNKVHTNDNTADIFTKALGGKPFNKHRNTLLRKNN